MFVVYLQQEKRSRKETCLRREASSVNKTEKKVDQERNCGYDEVYHEGRQLV